MELCLLGEGSGTKMAFPGSPPNQKAWHRESNQDFPLWTLFEPTPYKPAHGFLKSVCNCQPCSHVRHKNPSAFRTAIGLLCIWFLSSTLALSCAGGDAKDLSLCRVDSPNGSSFMWASLPLWWHGISKFPLTLVASDCLPSAPYHSLRSDVAGHPFQMSSC